MLLTKHERRAFLASFSLALVLIAIACIDLPPNERSRAYYGPDVFHVAACQKTEYMLMIRLHDGQALALPCHDRECRCENYKIGD